MSRIASNESSFITAVLTDPRINAPVTQSNVNFLETWFAREGTAAQNNPLASKLHTTNSFDLPGNSPGNPDKVQQYPTTQEGIDATVRTLTNGLYPNILNALKAGNATEADASGNLAPDFLTWSGGAYSTLSGTQAGPTRAIGGGAARGSAAGGGQPLSGDALVQYADQNFPQYSYLLHDPEVGPILVKAAQDGVSDPNILAGMLRNTQWWQHTSSTMKSFDKLQADDPATWEQAVRNQARDIDLQARQMGVGLPGNTEYQLAVKSLRLGWTQTILTQTLASMFKAGSPQSQTGQAATDAQQLQALYHSYALKISPQQLNQDLQNVLAGNTTVDNLRATAQGQAETAYSTNPQLVAFLKEGRGTTYDWASQHIQRAASVLGVDPNSIDLTAPMWSPILNPGVDPATGKSTGQALSLDQWETKLRNDPQYGFDTSINGVQQGAQLGNTLAKILGVGGI